MGVTITAKNSAYEFDMGYGGFFNLRKNIAFALDKDFGENYALGSCWTERQFKDNDRVADLIIKRKHLYEKYKNTLDFLYMKDTDG